MSERAAEEFFGGPPRTSSFFNYVIALQTSAPQGLKALRRLPTACRMPSCPTGPRGNLALPIPAKDR